MKKKKDNKEHTHDWENPVDTRLLMVIMTVVRAINEMADAGICNHIKYQLSETAPDIRFFVPTEDEVSDCIDILVDIGVIPAIVVEQITTAKAILLSDTIGSA